MHTVLDAAPGSTRLALPPHPPEPHRPGFPWLASVAPVAGAVALWAITGSAYALLFAALGPVVAVASLLDGRRQARRMQRRARRERRERLRVLTAEIDDRHALECAAEWRRTPGARRILEGGGGPAWHDAAPGQVVLGTGTVESALHLDGAPEDDDDLAVVAHASRLPGAPVVADPADGIGFIGPPPLARAAARAVLVQCAHRTVPGSLAVLVPDHREWTWARRLPHHGGDGRVIRVFDAGASEGAEHHAETAVVAVAAEPRLLPPGVRTVVRLEGPLSATVERRGTARPPERLQPALLGAAEAERWAEQAMESARRAGLVSATAELPRRVELATLTQPLVAARSRTTLRVVVGIGARVDGTGELELDLVRGGPHAIVAGTTGSGKSEFLLAWLTALALAHPPDRVAFLLVDFKGGAAFEPIRSLPHVTGIVTDLDEGEAARAVASLRAELRRRERVLQGAGVRDIGGLDESTPLPRLVVVVDEFQAMIERFPDLGPVIGDIAARGRSLGVHLVLAAQRPNGVVREQVTANCPIRVSLRVMHRADSVAVVGVDAAAAIEPGIPGRGIVDPGDGRPVAFQSAIADASAISRARDAHAGSPRPRRPWLDPLPTRVGIDELAASSPALQGGSGPTASAYLLGLSDEPERQRRDVAVWSPRDDGHLLVLGVRGSGRTSLLEAVARQATDRSGSGAVVRIGGPRSAVWDALVELAGLATPGAEAGRASPDLVVIDDLDGILHAWPDDYRHAALLHLEGLLRSGGRQGIAVAAGATRINGFGQSVRDGFSATALLRHPTRADLVHSGGDGALFTAEAPPGAGQWRGRRTQFAHGPAPVPAAGPIRAILPLRLDPGVPVAVVTTAPRATAASLASLRPDAETILLGPGGDGAHRAAAALAVEASAGRTLVVGDTDAWSANWALGSAVRDVATIIVRGGGAEYRALARERELPPLLDEGTAQCWTISPGGPPHRALWPE